METLEPNMYVRTKKSIGKVYQVCKNEKNEDGTIYNKFILNTNDRLEICDTDLVVKASHNIIDLIEVGDYVNGFKIIRRFVNIHNGKKLLIALEKEEGYEYSNNLNDYMGDDSIHIYNEYIKTIVTKEQFESMQYEVK